MLQGIAFYLLATVAVLGGLMVVTAKNPVHSVLWLILAFFSSAGLFVLLGAEFLAMLLVVRQWAQAAGLPQPALGALLAIAAAAVLLEQAAVLGLDNFTVPLAAGWLWARLS